LRGAKRRSNPWRHVRRNGLLRGACHRARIRTTHWLAMTTGHSYAFPQHEMPRAMLDLRPSKDRGHRECRALCTPAASYALVESIRVRHHRYAETIRHSLRNGVTAYSGLSPETGL